ncbi:group II intron reverse transcriptase/maturase [Legionella sp.]|uniref:group II intron reverse transcriptase/maturase n=1 Tax=Legionella sp. TaxID=459 RepID=UPI00321F9ADC
MTIELSNGAPSAKDNDWNTINWRKVESEVRRLQVRIAKAVEEKRFGKVKALQWILTHSRNAKLLAVRRVTKNRGAKTPGIDGETWLTSKKKIRAIETLSRKGYKSQPMRRIYIPKKNGKKRPLGIPTMKDRAIQALYQSALEPIAETTADKNSYGFRPGRSCADAIAQCFVLLSRRTSADWVLEGDIKACFDKISHSWLMDNIPMDKKVLSQWLSAGFIHENVWKETVEGTPQGGVASPTLANMVLDGLEKVIKQITKRSDKVHMVRYADDFIITGNSREILENKIKPAIKSFLAERGLTLSDEKTHITYIGEGFDFLGFNIRKYKGKLLIKPSKDSIKSFLANIRETIKGQRGASAINLIRILNPKIRGWANYYRNVVSKHIFNYVDTNIFQSIWQWCKRNHPNKADYWIRKKYFPSIENRNWIFAASGRRSNDERTSVSNLVQAAHIKIKRHVKIKAEAHPYCRKYKRYFDMRSNSS